jgi:hypothetical protein
VGARRRAPGAGRSGRWRSSGSGVGGLRGRRRDLARSTGPAQDAEVKERRRWRLQLGNTAGTRSRRGAGMVYLPPPTGQPALASHTEHLVHQDPSSLRAAPAGLVHPRPRESQQVWFITRPRQFLQFRVRTSSSSSRGFPSPSSSSLFLPICNCPSVKIVHIIGMVQGSWTGVFIWFVRILTAKCCSSGKAWTTDSRQIVKI